MSDMQTVIRRLIELGRTDLAEVAAKCEAELAAANASIERLRDDVHYAWQTEREVRTKLAAFEDSCRRVVARRKEDGAFIVLTVDLERIESMLATTVAAPAAPAVPDGVARDAARYRFLRGHSMQAYRVLKVCAHLADNAFDDRVDAAILSTTEGRKDE